MNQDDNFLFCESDPDSLNFDKATKIRANSFELNRLLTNPNTSHILIWRGKILFNFSSDSPRVARLNCKDNFWYNSNYVSIKNGSFVGFQDQKAIFYHTISDWDKSEADELRLNTFSDDLRNCHPNLPTFLAFCELRSLMTVISKKDATALASIKGIYEWNRLTKYCANCGAKIVTTFSGWEKICNSCNSKCFPRTDPVVIMMVYFNNKALLGRSHIWPKGMFSCLAGFMEPGETIEAAVKRETFEESGIRVKNVQYVTNQPWPFPASLMIGCLAEAESDEIVIDKNEIEDARWFSRTEIRNALDSPSDWWPARKGSIARFLINQWAIKNL